LARDRLDDVGPGDEHLAGLVDHDDEVGEGGGVDGALTDFVIMRSEEHTSELQSQSNLVCRLLLEKKKTRLSSGEASTANPTARSRPSAAQNLLNRSRRSRSKQLTILCSIPVRFSLPRLTLHALES